MQRNQRGFTLPTIPSILIAGGILTFVSLNQLETYKQELKAELSDNIREELVLLVDGLQACYGDTRAWCDYTQIEALYGGENGISIVNNVITTSPSGQNLAVSVDTNNAEFAAQLKRYFPNATSTGSVLNFTIAPPTASHLFQENIQRYSDGAGFQRNVIDQTVSFSNNDVKSVGLLQANKGTFDNYATEGQTLENISIKNQLSFANGFFKGTGNTLFVQTPNAAFNGSVMIAGSINANGSLKGINSLQSNNVNATNTLGVDANISRLSGTSVSYTNGDIDTITATSMSGETFIADSVNLQTIRSTHLEGIISADQGSIDNLNFTQAVGRNWSYGNSTSNSINSNASMVGLARGGDAHFSSGVTGGSFAGERGNFTSLISSGNFIGGSFLGNDFCTGSACVNSNSVAINNNSDLININTGKVNSNKSSVSTNTALTALNGKQIDLNEIDIAKSTSDISNNTLLTVLNSSSIDVNARSILTTKSVVDSNTQSSIANANNINSVYPSLQSARNKLNTLTGQLANCMDTTQYCYPQEPSVNLSCNGCNESSTRSNFSATIAAFIRDCRQGCNYRWQLSGVSGNCPSGSVRVGSTKNLSCRVSASVTNGEVINGSAKLIVTNSHYTSKTDVDIEQIRWANTTPNVVSCPAAEATRDVGNTTAKFTFPIGTEGQRLEKAPDERYWGCDGPGGVSHVEGEAIGICRSSGTWDINIIEVKCIRD